MDWELIKKSIDEAGGNRKRGALWYFSMLWFALTLAMPFLMGFVVFLCRFTGWDGNLAYLWVGGGWFAYSIIFGAIAGHINFVRGDD